MRIKYPPPASQRWAVMQWADIPSKSDRTRVYLRRLRIIQTPWSGVYLHWINEPDTDRDPHDHPWTFWSLVIRGGYIEAIYERLAPVVVTRSWARWSWHRMPLRFAHRIMSVQPATVTLVFTGHRVREWGFFTDQGFVPWREYVMVNDVA